MPLEGVTLILVGVANSMRKKNYLSSLLRYYILENWYFDELSGLFIILKIKILVCQWTMLWKLKCIWCGVFFTDTSLPFEIRLTIVEQNGSNVNATVQASVSSPWKFISHVYATLWVFWFYHCFKCKEYWIREVTTKWNE